MVLYWNALLEILPPWMRAKMEKPIDIREVRLRIGHTPLLCCPNQMQEISGHTVRSEDLHFVINAASRCSPYSVTTINRGFLTARGGHRVGLCGSGIYKDGQLCGIRDLRSVCIRVARDITGISNPVVSKLDNLSALILGPPGSGKTTFLRDLIRELSGLGNVIAVVDERCELFPADYAGFQYAAGPNTDVLSGVQKPEGIEMLLRTMSPQWIALDEISSEADCITMEHAGYCGVRFLATCHAFDKEDLFRRSVYRKLMESGIFRKLIIMHRDQTFTMEELTQ